MEKNIFKKQPNNLENGSDDYFDNLQDITPPNPEAEEETPKVSNKEENQEETPYF